MYSLGYRRYHGDTDSAGSRARFGGCAKKTWGNRGRRQHPSEHQPASDREVAALYSYESPSLIREQIRRGTDPSSDGIFRFHRIRGISLGLVTVNVPACAQLDQ